MNFVNLHLHTQYSALDSCIKIPELIIKLKENNMTACAITDHGTMAGAVQFTKQCVAAGIKPILGQEFYVSPGSRFEKRKVTIGEVNAGNFHLTVLAKNEKGYSNLCKLSSLAWLEGMYYKPRVDFELLKEYSEGLIVLSGCLASELARYITASEFGNADNLVRQYRDIFGEDYYLEVHENRILEQTKVNNEIREISRRLGVAICPALDCHALNKEDFEAHEILLCAQTNKKLSDPDHWKFSGDSHYVMTQAEAEENFKDWPGACDTTVDVAKKCTFEIKLGQYEFPLFQVPKEYPGKRMGNAAKVEGEPSSYFRTQCVLGLQQKCPSGQWTTYFKRLNFEINAIVEMGLVGYLLIVTDFIQWAKNNDVLVGPGRGSVAGSLVAYCLGITEVDPIPNGLLFERFINPGRKNSLCDVDSDFSAEDRDKVFEYVKERYGASRVNQIATFGTLKAKAALKDVGRVLEIPFAEMNKITRIYPASKHGQEYPLAEALEMEPRLVELKNSSLLYDKLFRVAERLENLTRHASKHAAGVVISKDPIIQKMPLMKDRAGNVLTQYAMNDVDAAGLIKFDFLGLKTLTLLKNIVKKIKETKSEDINVYKLPLTDQRTFDLFSRGNTTGVFQFESGGIRKLITEIKPTSIADISLANSLFRPGPLDSGLTDQYLRRRKGLEPVEYPHEDTNEFLSETLGIMAYQEQVMKLAQVLAGYTLAEADDLRKAIGKKIPEAMQKERAKFINGSAKVGKITKEVALMLFEQIDKFAFYCFNKCLGIDTKVSTPCGNVVVKNIKAGDHIYAFDTKTESIYIDIVEDLIDCGEQETFLITFSDGAQEKCTINHKFLCEDMKKHTLKNILQNSLKVISASSRKHIRGRNDIQKTILFSKKNSGRRKKNS